MMHDIFKGVKKDKREIQKYDQKTRTFDGDQNEICPDCQGRGYICKVFGETKTCLKCLRAGRLG